MQLSDLYDADKRTRDPEVAQVSQQKHIPHPLNNVVYSDGVSPCRHAKRHGRWQACSQSIELERGTKPARATRRGITRVLEEVRQERYRQIDKGWTAEHERNDGHFYDAFTNLACWRIAHAAKGTSDVRRSLTIEVIAILVAAVESMDRQEDA